MTILWKRRQYICRDEAALVSFWLAFCGEVGLSFAFLSAFFAGVSVTCAIGSVVLTVLGANGWNFRRD